jgi:hypothetical protein
MTMTLPHPSHTIPGSAWPIDWVEQGLNRGIDRHALGEMILEQLRLVDGDPRSPSIYVVYEFLNWGAGPMWPREGKQFRDEHTLWSALDEDQFRAAVSICAERYPNAFFRAWLGVQPLPLPERLLLRLSVDERDQLLADAARNLQSLTDVSLDALAQVPLELQLDLLRRLDGGSPYLLVRLALALGCDRGGPELFEEFAGMLEREPVPPCPLLWRMLNEADDHTMAAYIKRWLRTRAKDAGYVLLDGGEWIESVDDRLIVRFDADLWPGLGTWVFPRRPLAPRDMQ